MIHYPYENFVSDVHTIAKDIDKANFDAIVAISRGGLTFGHFLSQKIDQRNLYIINSIHYENQQKLETIEIFNTPNLDKHKRVIIVDDIVDSGDTISEVVKHLKNEFGHLHIETASLFYKESAIIKPDYWLHDANDWIDFFWDKDTR